MLKHSTRSHLGVSHLLEAEQPRRSQVGCTSLRPPVRRSSHLFGDSDEARLKTTCSEVDSPGAPAFNKAGDARAWLDSPQPKCSGPSLHERIGSVNYCVVCATAGVTPLGLGGNWLPPVVTSRSAPHTKRTRHETAAAHCTCTISCAVLIRTPAQPHVVTEASHLTLLLFYYILELLALSTSPTTRQEWAAKLSVFRS